MGNLFMVVGVVYAVVILVHVLCYKGTVRKAAVQKSEESYEGHGVMVEQGCR